MRRKLMRIGTWFGGITEGAVVIHPEKESRLVVIGKGSTTAHLTCRDEDNNVKEYHNRSIYPVPANFAGDQRLNELMGKQAGDSVKERTGASLATQTTQQMLERQNEMITELITITRDCVQACHLVIQTGKMNEIRREVQPLVNPQPSTFKRSYYRRANTRKDWQVKAVELYKQGLNAAEISAQLMVDYHTAYGFLRNHADYKPKKRRMGRIT